MPRLLASLPRLREVIAQGSRRRRRRRRQPRGAGIEQLQQRRLLSAICLVAAPPTTVDPGTSDAPDDQTVVKDAASEPSDDSAPLKDVTDSDDAAPTNDTSDLTFAQTFFALNPDAGDGDSSGADAGDSEDVGGDWGTTSADGSTDDSGADRDGLPIAFPIFYCRNPGAEDSATSDGSDGSLVALAPGGDSGDHSTDPQWIDISVICYFSPADGSTADPAADGANSDSASADPSGLDNQDPALDDSSDPGDGMICTFGGVDPGIPVQTFFPLNPVADGGDGSLPADDGTDPGVVDPTDPGLRGDEGENPPIIGGPILGGRPIWGLPGGPVTFFPLNPNAGGADDSDPFTDPSDDGASDSPALDGGDELFMTADAVQPMFYSFNSGMTLRDFSLASSSFSDSPLPASSGGSGAAGFNNYWGLMQLQQKDKDQVEILADASPVPAKHPH